MDQQKIETIKEPINKQKEEADINSRKANENIINENINRNKSDKELIRNTIIKNVYGENYDRIKASFKTMEDKAKAYFKDVIRKLEIKYEEFNSNIQKYFSEVTDKFTEAFNLDEENINEQKAALIQKYSKEYLVQLSKIVNMEEQILQSIKETIDILLNSLDISKNLDKEKPIQHFLEKEFTNIIKSWLFIKLDIEKFNFAKSINNSDLDENFKDFLSKVCQGKNFIMNIGPTQMIYDELNDFGYEEKNDNDGTMLLNNFNNLTRLKINKARSADSYFDDVNDFPKLSNLKFNNVAFSNEKKKYLVFKKCPNLEKLVINGANDFEIKMLENLSNNITKLILSNNNFVNCDFQNIMSTYIIKSDSLRRNLVLLSFSNNSISRVDLESLVHLPKQSFYSLKELDFHKNKITKFNISQEYFMELKTINCCYNKFSKSYFNSCKNILALLSGNLFLTDINVCKVYYNKLQKQLNEYKISLTSLCISYLPNELCGNYLSNIIINDNILISLKKVDLSYNDINCDTLFNFFNNNKGCLYLKKINLCGNKLDDTFFKRFIDLKLYNIFTRLQKINLNSNLIGDSNAIDISDLGDEPTTREENKMDAYKLRLIYKFIELNKNLSKLSITKNPIGLKSVISTDISMEDVPQLMQKDSDNHYIINCFYSFLLKILTELLKNKEEKNSRIHFNLKFDIGSSININSKSFNYKEKFIMFS